MNTEIILGIGMFTAIVLALAVFIIAARSKLVSSGDVTIDINGERNITLANIERIIAALHMKPSEFFVALDGHFRDIAVQRGTSHLNGFAPYFVPGIPRQTS